MSEDQTPSTPDLWINQRGRASFSSADEALERLVELKDVNFNDTFTNRDTELESAEGDGVSIVYYHEDVRNSLSLYTDEENDLSIRLGLVDDYCDDASNVMNKLLDCVSPITFEQTTVAKKFDIPFESLDLPIVDNPDLNVQGIRITHSGIDYIIQETDDHINVTATIDTDTEIEDAVAEDFIMKHIESIDKFVTEVL